MSFSAFQKSVVRSFSGLVEQGGTDGIAWMLFASAQLIPETNKVVRPWQGSGHGKEVMAAAYARWQAKEPEGQKLLLQL